MEYIAKLVEGATELVFVHRERQVADVDGESWCRGRLFWLHAAPLDGQTLARLWASSAVDLFLGIVVASAIGSERGPTARLAIGTALVAIVGRARSAAASAHVPVLVSWLLLEGSSTSATTASEIASTIVIVPHHILLALQRRENVPLSVL